MAPKRILSSFLGWDRHDITAAVRRRGASLTEVAIRAGLYECACRQALGRHHYRGEKAIAEFLEVKPADLWPERYDEHGVPLNPRTRQIHLNEQGLSGPRLNVGETLTAVSGGGQ